MSDTQELPTVITPMVRVELAALCRPARSFLGVTLKQREPVLAAGWSWVAWRSEGRAWRTKWGERPAGWLAQEVYSLRLAGPWSTGPVAAGATSERWRVVVLWSRPLVHLDKGKVSARTGRRPVATAAWSSEAWLWRSGRVGAVPRECALGDGEHLARTGQPAPEVWAAMAAPWAEAEVFDAARRTLVLELNASRPEYRPATRKGTG